MKDDKIAPINCLWCGEKIPEGRRGHGHPPKTCSEECRKARAADREKARYARIKDTPEWRDTRAAYIEKLKARVRLDPEFARRIAQQQQAIRDRFREKLEQDPQRLEAFRAKQRAWASEWLRNLAPGQLEDRRARHRKWYASLSREERQLRYYQAKMQRAQAQLDALEKEAGMLTNGMRPVHPGEVLREDFMYPLKMTGADLARRLGVTPGRVSDILRKKRGVTADTALRLARAFGGDARSWLNLQSAYDLRTAEMDSTTRQAVRKIKPRDHRSDS